MKICFIYKEDYPWDVRVEKIANLLVAAGHSVTILARNDARRSRHEAIGGFEVLRLPTMPRAFGRLNDLLGIPTIWNPVWFFATLATLIRTKADAVLVRDLPLMPTALAAAGLLRLPVVFDMAECYPEMYASILKYGRRKFLNLLTKNPSLTAAIERFAVRRAAHIFVMIEESRDRLLAMGAPPDRITIASNTPPPPTEQPKLHVENERLRLFYVGFVTRIRGLDNALGGIAAYTAANPGGPAIEFNVVGKGEARAELEQLASRLGIADQVHFHGWQDQEVVDELYRTSDIGVLTYHVCGHWNHTIPNKLFDYMRSGIPVLATDVVPIHRIVKAEGCGIVFADYDTAACAEALAQLSDFRRRNAMGGRGYEAVRQRYNWDRDGACILGYFAKLAAQQSNPGRTD